MATVVLAPNAFKGSLGAPAAAEALAAGWRSVRPGDTLVLLPVADGGDGTLDAVEASGGGTRHLLEVPGPAGGTAAAPWLALPDGTALVELAAAGGLALADRTGPPDPARAARASTLGFGRAVRAAIEAGSDEVLLAVGGSASTDGGAGFLTALGARLLDAAGDPVPAGNAGLAALHRIDVGGLVPLPARGARILTDVTNPLLGPDGAAAVFGPQKGAGPADVPVLERNLARLAEVLADVLAADPRAAGAGAAGGLAFGAAAWGATIVDGADAVADRVGLPAALAGADAVVTGEGRYDRQTTAGKAPERVRLLALAAGAAPLLVAGSIDAPTDGWHAAVALADLAGSAAAAIAAPARFLERAGARLAADWAA